MTTRLSQSVAALHGKTGTYAGSHGHRWRVKFTGDCDCPFCPKDGTSAFAQIWLLDSGVAMTHVPYSQIEFDEETELPTPLT